MSRLSRLSLALLVLFVMSGFAGLLYQSVWSHYLGLSLGHAAYAQTLVLAIFMGGMAIGAWLSSRYSTGWKRLILGYAVVEGVIGLFGLVFHPLFVAYAGFSQETLLPAVGSAPVAHTYQWLSAALLITPQSILLGATFPLMSAGLIRVLPNEHGEVLGGLYFTNSLGAALGALLATFVLLPAVGLPGTVLTAGILNILVALVAWMLSRMLDESAYAPLHHTLEAAGPGGSATGHVAAGEREAMREPGDVARLGRVLLWATAISGAASFVYEVGWVRLLNQALGSTIHSFELMLAAFILGLAFGGLWVRKRARHITEPVRYVGYVQVLMAVAALVSIPVFTQSFTWVGWIMGALSRTAGGYTLYELGTAAISLLVMFPAAFLAGMTLPLFTLALLRAGAGERSIGRIYAANTLGAIVGVALMMHVLIPAIGVRLGVTLGALVDGLVGLYLLRAVNPARTTPRVAAVALLLVAATVFGVLMGRPDPREQVSGVFRTGTSTIGNAEVEFLKDGKTATVAMISRGPIQIISTNGKPDASLTPLTQAPTEDEVTMIMAGALPLALHPEPRRIAIIGWGSGLTTHTVLGSGVPQSVDTIEIERAMVEGARGFGERVARAYEDPRSTVHFDDARTFFSTGARKYDAIISEPSNPWVSGVASLFTREFYAFLKRHLNDGGMLVQWLHSYELDDALVGTMMAALAAEFPYADLYLTNTADLLIVARTHASAVADNAPALPGSPLQAELQRVGLGGSELLQLRRLGGADMLRNFVRMTEASPHSDYFPTVSLQAPRTRFMGESSTFLPALVTNGLPVLDILECRTPIGSGAEIPDVAYSTLAAARRGGIATAESLLQGSPSPMMRAQFPARASHLYALLAVSEELAVDGRALLPWSALVADAARHSIGLLPASDLGSVWIEPQWVPEAALAHPEARMLMDAYSATAERSPVRMRVTAERVLALPADRIAPLARQQMLAIAMLGALGSGLPAEAELLDARWGPEVGSTPDSAAIRSYLLAWADSDVPACVAEAGPGPAR